jgi:hypothetical protein
VRFTEPTPSRGPSVAAAATALLGLATAPTPLPAGAARWAEDLRPPPRARPVLLAGPPGVAAGWCCFTATAHKAQGTAMSAPPPSTVEDVRTWFLALDSPLDGYAGDAEGAGVDGQLLSEMAADELRALIGVDDEDHIARILEARDLAFSAATVATTANTVVQPSDHDVRLSMLASGPGSSASVAEEAAGEELEEGIGDQEADEPEPVARIYPPLYQAVKRRDIELVVEMLSDGIDPNSPEECTGSSMGPGIAGRRTPLHFAAIYQQSDIMRVLLANDPPAGVNSLDAQGWTGLHYSALNGNTEIASMLLGGGADPCVRIVSGGGLGETCVEFARRHGQHRFADCVEALAGQS